MTRILRYPRLLAASCVCTLLCAAARDLCVNAGLSGWGNVLLVGTFILLMTSCVLLSCRFFLDSEGVGVGFLLRTWRTPWHELTALGVLCCNSRRPYLYGLYRNSPGFLHLLHQAPRCGSWGFVVPLSDRLVRALFTSCPKEIDFSPIPRKHPEKPMHMLWHHAALYTLLLLPFSALAFFTSARMLIRASTLSPMSAVIRLTFTAFLLFAAGLFLGYRVLITLTTCPFVNEEGVRTGFGLYMPWSDIRFGYVHRMAQVSGMFMLSVQPEDVRRADLPPVRCLSMPDTSTLLLAYLTYCPYAEKELYR